MPKIHKVYPAFYNGVSQQKPELILDNQCKEMLNCVPNIVEGLHKRPPVLHKKTLDYVTNPEMEEGKVFHVYDRGEDNEEYIFVETGDADNPVAIFNLDGDPMTVVYNTDNETELKDYLANSNLKALTVQDRTWVFSKSAQVGLDYTDTAPLDEDYQKIAYYWLKRGSGDRYNPYNYAVYLNGTTYAVNPNKPSLGTQDPVTGAEDSDKAAEILQGLINDTPIQNQASTTYFAKQQTKLVTIFIGKAVAIESPSFSISGGTATVNSWNYDPDSGFFTINLTNATTYTNTVSYFGISTTYAVAATITVTVHFSYASLFVAERNGSLLKIYRADRGDFEFSSWDSWGNQASEGWKGSIDKITDLPKDMTFVNVHVKITGETSNTATDYFVKWNGSSWEECLDPLANRGRLTNMPIKLDRTSLVAGVATFTFNLVDWTQPRVGTVENNPNPSFAPNEEGLTNSIQDVFFYKNRLGITAQDSVVLSETANYTNFYTTSVIDIADTDVIDITVATNQASKIYYTTPFNKSLFIFTKYAQYELVSEGDFSPTNVSLINTTNYPMATQVEPVVINNSLYFVSETNNRQQLREYIQTDSLNIRGVDLNVSTPTYLKEPIVNIVTDGLLGYIICTTATNKVYLYNFIEDGAKRVQSAWSTWTFLNDLSFTSNSFEYYGLDSNLLVICKTEDDYRYHSLQLDYAEENNNRDTSSSDNSTITTHSYESSILLPDYYPSRSSIRTPKHKVLLKKVTIEGEGNFDATVYRKDYGTTYEKSHNSSLRDLDLHIASKVGNVDITIKDSSVNDFNISSIIVEGLLTITSQQTK